MTRRRRTRCGFVAIVGAPNVGKSTLVNRVVGVKVSIVTPKAQTTRTRVLGLRIARDAQLVFVDTPGIFTPRRRLDRAMVAAAWGGVADADRVLLLVDSAKGLDADTRHIVGRLAGTGRAVVLALNKVDLVAKPALLDLTRRLNAEAALTETFTETFMVSAKTGDGVDDLVAYLARTLPEGPWLYPEDQVSDMPERLLAAEITRERLYLELHQELPYKVAVETESWRERDDGSVEVRQVVFIERHGQKGIVLGSGGRRIKAVGEASRRELESVLERRVHLFLFVKVRGHWGDDPERYRDWGLDFNA